MRSWILKILPNRCKGARSRRWLERLALAQLRLLNPTKWSSLLQLCSIQSRIVRVSSRRGKTAREVAGPVDRRRKPRAICKGPPGQAAVGLQVDPGNLPGNTPRV